MAALWNSGPESSGICHDLLHTFLHHKTGILGPGLGLQLKIFALEAQVLGLRLQPKALALPPKALLALVPSGLANITAIRLIIIISHMLRNTLEF